MIDDIDSIDHDSDNPTFVEFSELLDLRIAFTKCGKELKKHIEETKATIEQLEKLEKENNAHIRLAQSIISKYIKIGDNNEGN